MASGLYFLKLEINYMKDSTFNTVLTDAQKWRYIQLYMLAKECNAEGAFIRHGQQLALTDIAWYLHLDDEQLQADLEAIKGIGLICQNGHGPYLSRFVQEQETPKTDAERQQAHRDSKSQDSHAIVTVRDTESESESESDIESESESERESSVSESDHRPTDDKSLTDFKKLICSAAGIPPRFSTMLISDPKITQADLLAELAWNFSRKAKVYNPGYITGLNLSKGERPGAVWYTEESWNRYIPDPIRTKIGLVIQSEENDLDTSPLVAIRKSFEPDATVDLETEGHCSPTKAWECVKQQLSADMPKGNFEAYVEDAVLTHYEAGEFTFLASTPEKAGWLMERLVGTVNGMLMGWMDCDTHTMFVYKEPE